MSKTRAKTRMTKKGKKPSEDQMLRMVTRVAADEAYKLASDLLINCLPSHVVGIGMTEAAGKLFLCGVKGSRDFISPEFGRELFDAFLISLTKHAQDQLGLKVAFTVVKI